MKPRAVLAAGLVGLVWTIVAGKAGAELQLPPRSPAARVVQTVGLTQISLEYNSPAVAGRHVWGSVVTPGVLWRTGEALVPKIRFSRDVAVGGERVLAGTYALLTIPSDGGDWTVILNRDANLIGTADYRPELDLIRVKAPAQPAPHRERLTFSFAEVTDEEASLDLEWADRRVRITIKTFTGEQIESAIRDLDETPRRYAEAARYFSEVKHDSETARRYIDRSVALAEHPPDDGGEASALAGLPSLVGAVIEPAPVSAAFVAERAVRVRANGRPAHSPEPKEIAPLIKKGQGDIQVCYQRALRQDPSLTRARVTVSLDISVSGLVKDVRLDPPHPSPTLESCFKDAMAHWVFPLSPVEYGTEFPVSLRGRD